MVHLYASSTHVFQVHHSTDSTDSNIQNQDPSFSQNNQKQTLDVFVPLVSFFYVCFFLILFHLTWNPVWQMPEARAPSVRALGFRRDHLLGQEARKLAGPGSTSLNPL